MAPKKAGSNRTLRTHHTRLEKRNNVKPTVNSEETLQHIFSLLQAQSHIDFSKYKPSTIKRRVQRQMHAHRHESLENYLSFLQKNPDAVKELSNEMFIHVTEFFRNAESFKQLTTTVFPSLVKNRVPDAPIRIWVPACSSGEEPYSIAMSLLEFLGSKAAQTPIQIFGTDISERAIQEARLGLYSNHQVKGISETRLKRFFEKTQDGYKVKKNLRDLCIFSRHDVTSSPPFAKIDLLSCRNLLIYFGPELQKHVMPIFHYALNPDGFLWLGKTEAPAHFSKLFNLVDKTHKIYRKLSLPSPVSFKFPNIHRFAENMHQPKRSSTLFTTVFDPQKEFDRIIMSRYAPASVMVNSKLEIIQVRGSTSPFIELPSGQPTHSLMKMIRKELLPSVRLTIQAAMKQNRSIRKEALKYEVRGEQHRVNLEVLPVNSQSAPEDRQYLILFEDEEGTQKKKASTRKKIGTSATRRRLDSDSYIRQLLEEIDLMREQQQSLIESYEAAQEELTSANEELQSANEELQSTNEEIETGKEELQAANEELTTLNEELENRNSELVVVNEKLALSEERFRLLVTGVKDYAIFMLDPEGRVATWNEGARRFKGYEENEILGKHFSIFYPQQAIDSQYPQMELKVAKEKGRFEDEGWRIRKDGSKFWANVVITKISDKNGNLLGFSKVTRDLTERKKMEDALRRSRDELEIRVKQRTEELTAALQARDEFLSIASHELKTPLTSLKLQIQMDRRRLMSTTKPMPLREELIESSDLAIKQINSLADLVEDLLDISRIQTGHFSLSLDNLNLSDLVREIVNRFSQQLEMASCMTGLDLDESVVGSWDRHRLEQVVVNLIANVIKYAPRSQLNISVSRQGETASLVVQDSGPGIPKDMLPKVFERFERAGAAKNIGGLGLGLFIVRKIVEAHQGKIRVESGEGMGTKFTVELPLHMELPRMKDDK